MWCCIRGIGGSLTTLWSPEYFFFLKHFTKLLSRAREKAYHLADRTQAQTLTYVIAFAFLKDYLPADQGRLKTTYYSQPKQWGVSNFVLPAHSFEAHGPKRSFNKMLTSGLSRGKSPSFASGSRQEVAYKRILDQHSFITTKPKNPQKKLFVFEVAINWATWRNFLKFCFSSTQALWYGLLCYMLILLKQVHSLRGKKIKFNIR